ncbi:hypothetical protein [Chryseobacterium oncorhynchi]|uniref:Uncharacterized protein n=1 Tax=Chryseobacterium oncorhynchi TaxID=741074 RepID=A0A316WLM8_9FLAO|nr:hypothetical protein [Chryseobacterium oncorhynchi]PWN62314.1 hypothetical protein C1638_017635 [Chryseobacterium oncorhynchi]
MKQKDFGIQYISKNNGVFALDINIKRDSSGRITSGLVLGNTLQQNMASILIAEPGDLKNQLSVGVGIRSALLDEDLLQYRHLIKSQFAKDGLVVKHLDLYNLTKFSIDAEYE